MIQLTEPEYCKLDVIYTAPEDLVKQKKKEAVELIRKEKVKIPGFRPGKASEQAILQTRKNDVENWVKEQLIREGYNDAVYEHNLKTIFQPMVRTAELMGDSFWCNMEIYKKPDFELKQYKDFEIPQPAEKNIDEEVARILETIRTQNGNATAYEDTDVVEVGDKITCDIVYFFDGVKQEALSQEGVLQTIGENPAFETCVVGMKAGETRRSAITGEQFVAQTGTVLGADMQIPVIEVEITVHMGLKTEKMPLDDSLAQKLNMTSLDELRKLVAGSVVERAQTEEKEAVEKQITNRLLEQHQFKVPEWLLQMEVQRQANIHKIDLNTVDMNVMNQIKDLSEKQIRLSFIFDSVRDAEPDTSFSERELIEALRRKAQMQGQNPDEVIQVASQNGSLVGMIAGLRDQATMEFIRNSCKLVS